MNRTDRATCWSVTINNPTQADEDYMSEAQAKPGWTVTGQLEVGAGGTEHYQLMVTTPQVRFSALKKAFPRSHIEVAREPKALAAYVVKDATRAGKLPDMDMYPSQSAFYNLVVKELDVNPKPATTVLDMDDKAFAKQVARVQAGQLPKPSNEALDQLDWAVKRLISQGYHVEHHGCNPQVRSAWKLYNTSMRERYQLELEKLSAKAIEDANRRCSEIQEREEGGGGSEGDSSGSESEAGESEDGESVEGTESSDSESDED